MKIVASPPEAAVKRLLSEAGLPTSDITPDKMRSFFCFESEGFTRKHGISSLFLLTTTAESFFRRLGYERVPREDAPPEVQNTSEFSDICPVSSAFMLKRL